MKTLNEYIAGRAQAPTPADTSVAMPAFVQECEDDDGTLNSVHAIGILPAGYVPKFASVDSSGLGNSAKVSVGILNAGGTDLSTETEDGGAAWLTAQDVGGAGVGALTRTVAIAAVKPVDHDRRIAVKFTTASNAPGTMTVNVAYVAP